jgi:cytochrome c-type biogenesis protein CcmE
VTSPPETGAPAVTDSDAAEYDLVAPSPSAATTPSSASLTPAAARRGRGGPGTRARLVAAGAVLLAAFVFLAIKGLGGSFNYFETVDQALSHKAMLGSQTFRLEGLVVPGTVHRSRNGVDFMASGTGHQVAVVNTGNPPQLFQPDIPVVVVGHFVGATFFSNQIIVDHTAQYIEQHPTRVRAPNGTSR